MIGKRIITLIYSQESNQYYQYQHNYSEPEPDDHNTRSFWSSLTSLFFLKIKFKIIRKLIFPFFFKKKKWRLWNQLNQCQNEVRIFVGEFQPRKTKKNVWILNLRD